MDDEELSRPITSHPGSFNAPDLNDDDDECAAFGSLPTRSDTSATFGLFLLAPPH